MVVGCSELLTFAIAVNSELLRKYKYLSISTIKIEELNMEIV